MSFLIPALIAVACGLIKYRAFSSKVSDATKEIGHLIANDPEGWKFTHKKNGDLAYYSHKSTGIRFCLDSKYQIFQPFYKDLSTAERNFLEEKLDTWRSNVIKLAVFNDAIKNTRQLFETEKESISQFEDLVAYDHRLRD